MTAYIRLSGGNVAMCGLRQNGRLVGGPSSLIGGGFRFLGDWLWPGVGLVVDEVLLRFDDLGASK